MSDLSSYSDDDLRAAAGLPKAPASPVTTPEPNGDVQAQLKALIDPSHPKDAMFLAPGNASSLPQLPNNVQALPSSTGTFLTTNSDKATKFKSLANPSDADMAALLGYPVTKSDAIASGNPSATQARDKDGNVVFEALTSPEGAPQTNAAAQSQMPSGGSIVQMSPQALQARRAGVDLSQFSDEDLKKFAGPIATPASTSAVPAMPTPLPGIEGMLGAARDQSGKTVVSPDFYSSMISKIPFAQDAAGLANALPAIPGAIAGLPQYMSQPPHSATEDIPIIGPLASIFNGIGANKDFSALYDQGRKETQNADAAYAAANPDAATAAHTIGILGGLGNIESGAAQGGSLLARSLRSAAVGAPTGAVYAYGSDPGDSEGRLKAAGIGGALGGVVGGIAPSVAEGVSSGYGTLKDVLGSLGQGDFSGALHSLPFMAPAEDKATAKLASAFGRDNLTPDAVQQTLDQFPNKPMTITDAAGPSTSRLTRAVLDVPGEGSSSGQQFLQERDLGTGVNGPFDMFKTGGSADRVVGDVQSALGSDDPLKTVQDLMAQRKAAAAPLYDAFRQEQPVASSEIAPFMSSPTFRKAVGRANGSILDEGGSPLTDYIDFNAAGDPMTVKDAAFPPDTLDRIKQGIDDTWLAAKQSGDAGDIRTANSLRQRFLGFMDDKFPDTYAQARSAFAGPSQSIGAIQQGAEVFNTAPQDIAKTLQGLAPDDQDMFRLGVQQALVNKVKNTSDGVNEVRVMLGSPAKREAIAAAFNDPAQLDQLSQSLGAENRMYQTKQLAQGSRTAPSLLDANELMGGMGGDILNAGSHAVNGNLLGAAIHIIRPITARINGGATEATRNALAQSLLSADPQVNAQTLDAIRQMQARNSGSLSRMLMLQNPTTRLLSGATGDIQ